MSAALGTVEAAMAFQLALAAVGLLLIPTWFALRARGIAMVPAGVPPAPAFRATDGALVLVAWLAAQVAVGGSLYAAGARDKVDLALAVKLAEAAVVAVPLALWFRRRAGAPGPAPGRAAASGLLACLAFLPVAWAILLAWQGIYHAAGAAWEEQDILRDLRGAAVWKFVALAVVLAPLTEEVIFRGILHALVKRETGRWAGALVSAAAFTAVHGSLAVAPAIFVLGLALAWVYERTGTLLAPIAFHAAFNSVTVVGELMKRGG